MNLKKFFTSALLLICVFPIVGVMKYNADLNAFLNQTETYGSSEKSFYNTSTEIYVLGTVHFETDSFKRGDLYRTLERISPSVILYEADERTLKKILSRRDYFFQLMDVLRNRTKTKVEKPVVLKYLDHHPSCEVLPYEWEEKSEYQKQHKITSTATKMFQSILALRQESQLSEEHAGTMDHYIKLIRELNDVGANGTLETINNTATDSLVQQRQFHKYHKLTKIVSERNDLDHFKEFSVRNQAYWDLRNKAMAQNIIKHAQMHPNKRIVVLNGFYHRYFLKDELKKYQDEYGYSLMPISN